MSERLTDRGPTSGLVKSDRAIVVGDREDGAVVGKRDGRQPARFVRRRGREARRSTRSRRRSSPALLSAASIDPSGLKKSELTPWLGGGLAKRLAGPGIPPAYRFIVGRRRDQLSVGTEGDGMDRPVVLQRAGEQGTGGEVPEPGRAVFAGGRQPPSFGAKRDGVRRAAMTEASLEQLRSAVPAGQARANDALQIGRARRRVFEGAGQPEHALRSARSLSKQA